VTDCLIVGVGGQGTILASRLIGNAALRAGLDVRGSETIGMAQRGGCVMSHVRMGTDIKSPLITPGRADVVLAFEPCEAARAVSYLKPGGLMVVCDRAVQPAGVSGGYDAEAVLAYLVSSVGRLCVLDGEYINARCGARCLNVAIIGAALSLGAFPYSTEDMESVGEERFEASYAEMNKRALSLGASMSADLRKQIGDW
jgi:indolepyruvate ferredoxin oxidoreductase beta subunit